jgi:hypothetical protein
MGMNKNDTAVLVTGRQNDFSDTLSVRRMTP